MTARDTMRAAPGARHLTIPEELLRHQHVPDRAKLLYALLQSYLGGQGAIFPSRSTLAGSLGCSEDSIDRATRELVEWGYLDVIRRVRLADGSVVEANAAPAGGGWKPTTNEYVLLAPPEARDSQVDSRRLAAPPSRTVAALSGSGVPESAKQGSDRAAALRPTRRPNPIRLSPDLQPERRNVPKPGGAR